MGTLGGKGLIKCKLWENPFLSWLNNKAVLGNKNKWLTHFYIVKLTDILCSVQQ